jgi:hypothetical protein
MTDLPAGRRRLVPRTPCILRMFAEAIAAKCDALALPAAANHPWNIHDDLTHRARLA